MFKYWEMRRSVEGYKEAVMNGRWLRGGGREGEMVGCFYSRAAAAGSV